MISIYLLLDYGKTMGKHGRFDNSVIFDKHPIVSLSVKRISKALQSIKSSSGKL